MADVQTAFDRGILRRQQFGASLASAWLLFLYALFCTFVVLSFSAYQLQTTIQNYKAASGKDVALWSVKDLYERWKVDADQLENLTDRYRELSTAAEYKYNKIRGSKEDISKIYDDCRNDIRSYIDPIYMKIVPINVQYANFMQRSIDTRNFCKDNYITIFLDDYLEAIALKQNARRYLYETRDRQSDVRLSPEDLKDPVPSIKDIVKAYNSTPGNNVIRNYLKTVDGIMTTALYNNAEIDKINAERSILSSGIDHFQKQLILLFNGRGQNFDDTIGSYLTSLRYFEGVEHMPYLGRVIPDFSRMPPDTLTLMLVLAMGALGGTIQLSRRHLAALDINDEQGPIQPSYYVFRPFFGAITALSIYILIKAGVLVASAPSPTGDTANLSPFFISFLAIVSGLLAEQALETIEQAGGNFFARSKTPPAERWAYGLKAALTGDDGSPAKFDANAEALAQSIGAPKEQILRWANENEPVPDPFQKLVAAFFHLPPRSLFTDIKA